MNTMKKTDKNDLAGFFDGVKHHQGHRQGSSLWVGSSVLPYPSLCLLSEEHKIFIL